MRVDQAHPHIELFEIPHDLYQNLIDLCAKITVIEEAFIDQGGTPFFCTSGFRTWKHHKEIYQRINDARLIHKKPEIPIPINSKHLFGNAADISDPEQKLQIFLKTNVALLEQNNLWCESFKWTPHWVHFQRTASLSGDRFFKPF